LWKQDAEDDPFARPYPNEFLPGFVTACQPVSRSRDEMLGDPELIVVLRYPSRMAVCGLAVIIHPSSASCCMCSSGCSATGDAAYNVCLLTVVTTPTAATL
jgi:hypothetical protein